MPNQKYTHLDTLLEVNTASNPEDKNIEAHIMSVSKSFCGATTALMAADGMFGKKKINASLLDVIAEAKERHPERMEQIREYENMIIKKGCGDVTLSELLSHRSGFIVGDDYLKPNNLSNIEIFQSNDLFKFDRDQKSKNIWSYCNPGFVLIEDLINLISDSHEGYYGELKNRIIEPLGLTHTKSIYESPQAMQSASDTMVIEGIMYDYGVLSQQTSRSNFLNATQKGRLALSEGGLCSSVHDLEIFYEELANMACGIENSLANAQQTRQIHQFYLDAYRAGQTSNSSSANNTLFARCAKEYSLGVMIEAVNEDLKPIPSRGNEEARISFHHLGGSASGNAFATAIMPFSFSEFTNSTAHLRDHVQPEYQMFIKQSDVLTKNSLLTLVSCDYIAQIEAYFSAKCDQTTDKHYNDLDDKGVNWRTYNLYFEAARTEEKAGQEWQKSLIANGRLPSDFDKFHDAIMEAYRPAREVLFDYVRQHYLKDGVLDSEKIKNDFNKADDFNKIKAVIEPYLQQARQQTQDIFERADQKLAIEGPVRKEIAASTIESILSQAKDNVSQSWVERVSQGSNQDQSASQTQERS